MATWTKEYMKQQVLAVTAFFETSTSAPDCFGVASGNHDGQGVSYGALQFNFGQSTLQPILTYMIDTYPDITKSAFEYNVNSAYYNEFVDVVKNRTVAQQITWGDSISNASNKHLLMEPWKTYFHNLGITQQCIGRQMVSAQAYYTQGEKLYDKVKIMNPQPAMDSRRLYALMFDIAVQCWDLDRYKDLDSNGTYETKTYDGWANLASRFNSISTTGKTKDEIEKEKLIAIVDCLANGYNYTSPSSVTLVHDRKILVANGSGDYYGTLLNLDNYGLTLAEAYPPVSAVLPFAFTNHNHDSTYAAKNHSHDNTYSLINHNHDTSYSGISHTHSDLHAHSNKTQLDKVPSALGTSGQVLAVSGTGMAWTTPAAGIDLTQPQTATGVWQFDSGLMAQGQRIANESSGTNKYMIIARALSTQAYNRMMAEINYASTGNYIIWTKIKMYMASVADFKTLSSGTYFSCYNDNNLGALAGDIVYVKKQGTNDYIIDIYAKVYGYAKVYINTPFFFAENGAGYSQNPDKGALLTALPAVNDVQTINSKSYTVIEVTNATVKSVATT